MTPADLQPLIDELTEAEVGSRYLDGRVWCAANNYEFVRIDPDYLNGRVGYRHGTVYYTHVQPHLTTSVDAILALIEKRLPGWTVANICQKDDKSWFAELREGHLTSYLRVALGGIGCKPPNPALALCIAFLTALAAQVAEGAAT